MAKEQQKRKDNDPSVVILRHLANFIAKLLAKTGITPNQVTVLNFIIFTPLIFYFLVKGTYIDNLIALCLIFVTIILDLCDGILARIKSIQSKFGAWLDGSLDRIFQFLIFCAVIIGVFRNTGNWQWFLPGLGVLFGQNIANYMGFCYDREFGFDVYLGSKEFNQKFANVKRISFLDSFLKNIIVPSNFIYISLFCCRYLLVLGILFNRLDIFLIAFGITINVRWLSMYFLYLRYSYGTENKLYTIKFLKELSLKKNENVK